MSETEPGNSTPLYPVLTEGIRPPTARPTLTRVPSVQTTGQVPEGYSLQFSDKGIPHLKKDDTSAEDDEAANEHVNAKLSVMVSQSDLEERFGIGIRLYFNFLKYVMISNAVLTVIAAVHWGYYLSQKPTSGFLLKDLFVSAYSKNERQLWMIMNIIAIVVWFLFGPIYYFYVRKFLQKSQIVDHDNPYLFTNDLDVIKKNRGVTAHQRFWKRVGASILFAILVCVSGALIFGAQYLALFTHDKANNAAESFGISIGITMLVSAINFSAQFAAIFLTHMECFRTWSEHRKHEGFKLILFKMVNVIIFYVGGFLAARAKYEGELQQRCYMEDAGLKFLTLILTDIFVFNVIEVVVPLVRVKLLNKYRRMRGFSGPDRKPEFDVAQEYLEIFYRQFVIYIGMIVFPMMTFLGLITNVLEFPLDKYRMLRLCQKPARLDLSMKTFLLFWMISIAGVALVCFPQGPVWVMTIDRDRFPGYSCCNVLEGTADPNITCLYYNSAASILG